MSTPETEHKGLTINWKWIMTGIIVLVLIHPGLLIPLCIVLLVLVLKRT